MTPAYLIEADGVVVTDAVRPYLCALTITDKPGIDSDELRLTLDDTSGKLALPRLGAILRVSIGWAGDLTYKGSYKVDEVSHKGPPDTIEVSAKAADFTGPLKTPRDQSYSGQTLGGILHSIANRNGLTPTIDAGLAARTIDHLDQTSESDGNFLVRLGKQHDAAATIKDGRLVFMPVGSSTKISGDPIPAVTIDRSATTGHTFGQSKRDVSFGSVKAKYQDHGKGETVFYEAKGGGDGEAKTLKTLYPSEAEAKTAAESELARLARGECKLSLSLAVGDPSLIANGKLTVTGFRSEITAPEWTITEVSHSLSTSGFVTSVSATSGASTASG